MSLTSGSSFPLHGAFFVGVLRTRVGCNRAPHTCVDLRVSCGSGVRWFYVRGRGSDAQSSYDTEHFVVSVKVRVGIE